MLRGRPALDDRRPRQNFDGGSANAATAATLPADFRVDSPSTVRTVGTFAARGGDTRGGGASLSATAAQRHLQLRRGTADARTRPRGRLLSSGTATQSGNLYAQLANNTGSPLTRLQISYDVEKYRRGTNAAGFRIQMFYSTDGVAWTSAGAGVPDRRSRPIAGNTRASTGARRASASVNEP